MINIKRFNTIQYDIDLKPIDLAKNKNLCFNTIQYDIDLKQWFRLGY